MANARDTVERIAALMRDLDVDLTEVAGAAGAAGVAERLREHTHTCTHTCTGASCMCARDPLGENVINPQTPGGPRRG